jgi:hypothetical protein
MSVGSVWLRLENSACRFQQGRMPLSMLKAAQRKMSSCPVTVAARWRELLTLLLLVPATALAQSNSRELVSKMVAKELEAQKQPRYWMYLDSKKSPARLEVTRVVQTPQCWLTWPLSINGHPPTEGERKHAREQIEHLVSDSDVRKKNRDEIDSDRRKSAEMLKMLPDAFLFSRDGRQGKSIRLKFRPNPEYHPTTNESKVFHSMDGVLLIDAKQTRLAQLSGTLASDVDFGFGILGKLKKGGTFEVTQSEVAPGDWEVSVLDVHISGRALFFHTIGEEQHEVKSQFKRFRQI